MPLHELVVVKADGELERRYTDAPVTLGQLLRLGSDRVRVVARRKAENPFATDGFICVPARTGSARART
jgi:hypothetical protein